MKIILSRKGFDFGNGGHASPILPDKRLISLPIHNPMDSDAYSELKFDSCNLKNKGLEREIYTYYDLMNELGIDKIKYRENKRYVHKKLDKETRCHLDPDIRKEVLNEEREAIFGQCKIAQCHLDGNEVRENDLFLFFGRFHETKINNNGKLEFDEKKSDLHIIFGYLQVGKIILLKDATEEEKKKYQRHPHINYPNEKCKEKCKFKVCNNTIYVASKNLILNGLNVPGFGVLNCSDDGVLTHKNFEKSISKWKLLPDCFRKISYHNAGSWHDEEEYFKSAEIGQEFVVVEADDEAKEWAKKIICAGINTN